MAVGLLPASLPPAGTITFLFTDIEGSTKPWEQQPGAIPPPWLDTILRVRHVEPTRSYWALPGGDLEPGEAPAEAAVREVREETGLRVQAVRLLREGIYGHGAGQALRTAFQSPRKPAARGHMPSLRALTRRRRTCPPIIACCKGWPGCRWTN